jgi:hypothetical protein
VRVPEERKSLVCPDYSFFISDSKEFGETQIRFFITKEFLITIKKFASKIKGTLS